MKASRLILAGIVLVLVCSVFRNWFGLGLLSGGDLQVYYPEMFTKYSFFPPPSWNFTLGAGLGVNGASLLWNYLAVQIPIAFFGSLLGFSWPAVQRIGYLFPYLILSLILPYCYLRKFLPPTGAFLGLLIFSFNTYILMLVSGGQIFLSLAYTLIPPVFYYFYILFTGAKQKKQHTIKFFCLASLFFSLQVLLDLRIAYVTLALVFLFLCVHMLLSKNYKTALFLPLVLVVTSLQHFFWLLPTLLIRQNPLASFGEEFVSSGIVKFLSFATFETTISLLQPNWPENIFGKVYFMRPEFLVLPILAFSSLLFLKNEKREKKILVLFFALTAILGSFFAKGTNEPFGGLYNFLFSYVPGFMMFRDPTKWYPLVAISYSFLIPYTLMKVSGFGFQVLGYKLKIHTTHYIILTTLYVLLLITPAWTGQLGGVLKASAVPADYLKLEQFLAHDKDFYRTFWIPRTSTYSFYSVIHPITTGYDFVREYSAKDIIKTIANPKFETILQDISVKYVIIPYDADGKIFLKDRKYDDVQYKKAVGALQKVSYLREVKEFGNMKVFEVPFSRKHVWSNVSGLVAGFTFINPTKYSVTVKNAKKGDRVILSENYDNNWIARSKDFESQISNKYSISKTRSLNSFVLSKEGDYSFEVYYTVQDWVNLGTVVSGISLLGVLLVLGWSYRKSNMFNS